MKSLEHLRHCESIQVKSQNVLKFLSSLVWIKYFTLINNSKLTSGGFEAPGPGSLSPAHCVSLISLCRVRGVWEFVSAGGDDPLRLSGPTELGGETQQNPTRSRPPRRHLLVCPHQTCCQIDAQPNADDEVLLFKHWWISLEIRTSEDEQCLKSAPHLCFHRDVWSKCIYW